MLFIYCVPDTILSTLYILTPFNPHKDTLEINTIFIITTIFSILDTRNWRCREGKSPDYSQSVSGTAEIWPWQSDPGALLLVTTLGLYMPLIPGSLALHPPAQFLATSFHSFLTFVPHPVPSQGHSKLGLLSLLPPRSSPKKVFLPVPWSFPREW